MNKYTFTQVFDPGTSNAHPSEVTVTFSADTYTEILEQFNLFLKGCGYEFNGEVGIIDE